MFQKNRPIFFIVMLVFVCIAAIALTIVVPWGTTEPAEKGSAPNCPGCPKHAASVAGDSGPPPAIDNSRPSVRLVYELATEIFHEPYDDERHQPDWDTVTKFPAYVVCLVDGEDWTNVEVVTHPALVSSATGIAVFSRPGVPRAFEITDCSSDMLVLEKFCETEFLRTGIKSRSVPPFLVTPQHFGWPSWEDLLNDIKGNPKGLAISFDETGMATKTSRFELNEGANFPMAGTHLFKRATKPTRIACYTRSEGRYQKSLTIATRSGGEQTLTFKGRLIRMYSLGWNPEMPYIPLELIYRKVMELEIGASGQDNAAPNLMTTVESLRLVSVERFGFD